MDDFDEHGRDRARHQRADEHRQRATTAADEECHRDARQNAVADGVTDQGHAAKDEVIADQAARGRDEKAHEHNPDEAVAGLRPRLDEHAVGVERWDEVAHGYSDYGERHHADLP